MRGVGRLVIFYRKLKIRLVNLTKRMIFYRSHWRQKIHVAEPEKLGFTVLLLLYID